MAPMLFKRIKKRIVTAAATVVCACLILTLGSLVPSFGLPSWGSVFNRELPTGTIPDGTLEVTFLDVGNADSILVQQEDFVLLIDAGERGDGDGILRALRKRGISQLDLVIATHPHADHIGGMTDVLENVAVNRFVMSFMPSDKTPTAAVYVDMLEALEARGIPVEEAEVGAFYEVGEAKLQVLAPLQESSDANDMSVVTRLTFGKHAFLFIGDAGTAVEQDLLLSGCLLKADVLKVAHHGSNSGSSKAFLKQVRPDYAVITCGENNSYGHPHTETLRKLQDIGASVCRSDIYGDMTFISDGTELITAIGG